MKILLKDKTYQSNHIIRDIVSNEIFPAGSVFRVINDKHSNYIVEDVESGKYILIDYKQTSFLR